ncbi:MAG TPA: UDP-N-acetylmuramoyl-L-alanine--D-glutamate ligase [Frankiaceae bacterium]|nr:UDP-N-acetylmuramoyl-L-alanine--D-glutamate ligase [Frankiaceae bacterium]
MAVLGVGVSGAAAATTLADLGARVRAFDDGDGEPQQSAAAALRHRGVEVLLGGLPTDAAALGAGVDMLVTSPGLRPNTAIFAAAADAGLPVWGEVELAYRLRPAGQTWLAVTGTNGKTTTTQMLGAILAAAGRRSTTAGNIGTPLLEAVTARDADGRPTYDVLAVELSSFQLHYTSTLAVAAGAVLNIAEDHLDWHGSIEAYAADKARVYSPGSVAIYNADDATTERLAEGSSAAIRAGFTIGEPDESELGVVDGMLVDRAFGAGDLLAVAELHVPGPHNLANALAAAALARAADVPGSAIAAALRDFRPGGHRNQVVAVAHGLTYVNDSKATNPHAAAASLAAYPSVVWIAGGLNKGLGFDDLVRAAGPRLRAAVLIGTCAEEIADALARHAPEVPVLRAGSMDDAVRQATGAAEAGDTVLLAPAAASMDMFRDYAARGDSFADAAREQEVR